MRVLTLHTFYQQPGGEDQSYAAEVALLKSKGNEVFTLTFHNNELSNISIWRQAQMAIWNEKAYHRLKEAIRMYSPDIAHVHNTFPLASPAVIHAIKNEGIPLIMTLRNYRLLCVNALFFRNGQVCEACLRHIPWRGALHGCYRDSKSASAVVFGMVGLHRTIDTWGLVDRFVALTEFARKKFIEGGFPEEKIVIKPNFVYPDPGIGGGKGGYALYVGRLSPEKGVRTLLKAWKLLQGTIPLKMVGEGPLAEEINQAAHELQGVEWLGRKSPEEVYALMGEAAFLIFPSEWYETFGRVAIEAFAKGTPVIASALGAVGEVTDHGRTGLHFRPGDPEDLADKVEWLLSHPQELARMRKEARAEYEAKYTAERNYEQLIVIYQKVLEGEK